MKPFYPVLKLGYIQAIEMWGDDKRIIESARMSTNGAFSGWGTPGQPGDEKLLAYLYKNKHMTPFEMCGMTIEVKAPIFVFREWHRHRTQSYNEMSARYIPLPNENYIPTVERICTGADQAAGNRQAAGLTPLQVDGIDVWLRNLERAYQLAQEVYETGLAIGIPKELARLPIPLARYSVMRASANLRNWLAFMTLRCDSHAQWEIRAYANEVAELIAYYFPRTYKLFKKEQQDGTG